MRIRVIGKRPPRPAPPGRDDGVWVEERIAGGWFARARVEIRSTRPVVVEFRLVSTGETVRQGGINQEIVRRVPFGTFTHYLLAAARFYHSDVIRGTRTFLAGPLFAVMPKLAGLTTALPRPRLRRASGRDDRFYVIVARDYLALIARGSRRPVVDLAAARGEKASRVRDMVHEARERGLLSPSKPGVRSGVLTARGVELLRQAPKRIAKRRPRR